MRDMPTGAVDRPPGREELKLQILGPLRIWRGEVELRPGPRQQAGLLAVLLAGVGRPFSADELIDLIWGQTPPPSALNTLHKYVGVLRHLLEPDLPLRHSGSYLQRRGNGYLCTATASTLDLVAFRADVNDARVALAEQRYEPAMDRYVQALGRWRGAAGVGVDGSVAATALFASIDRELLDAGVAAAALALSLGQPERVLPALRLAASVDPLHEPVQASLVSALGAAGQQAEALSVYRSIRVRLAEELGVDPGPLLVAAHARVLGRSSSPDSGHRPVQHRPVPPGPVGGLVGRTPEFAVLWNAVESALAGGSGLGVVEGEPGSGKTRLLDEIGAAAGRQQALAVRGRCLEGDGTPTMWPWVQIIGAVLAELPPAARDGRLAGGLRQLTDPGDEALVSPVLPDSGLKFRLFEQVVAVVRAVAVRRPVVLMIDDLQWADVASLEMFAHVASSAPGGAAVIGALRDRAPAPAPELVRMLARVGRMPRHRRVRLRPLTPDEVIELVRREGGGTLEPAAARHLHARTSGNPFFVIELARLLSDDAAVSTQRPDLPATVLDVVRHRTGGLDEDTRYLLQVAAVIGSDVEVGALARAIGIDVQTCLDRIDSLDGLGLIDPPSDDPRLVRFVHDIVRESVIESTPHRRVASIHLRVADALEHAKGADDVAVEQVAHHLWAAGALADPSRTADALICAGRAAAAKSAFEAADQRLQSAAQLARSAGLADLELAALSQLTAVVGMRSGYVGSALPLLERAEQLARQLGREREAADLLFSRWAAHSQGIRLDRAAPLAHRLLAQGMASTDPTVRAYGLSAWGIHQWDLGNIGEAFRYLERANATILQDRPGAGRDPLRRDLQLLWPVMLALMTALHGDVDGARSLLDRLEIEAEDDPYAITVWSAFSVVTAALAGDPGWAARAADRGIGVDPDRSYVFLGGYQRLARCWARAVTGVDPAGAAAEAEGIIVAVLQDPPRSGLATWYGLLAEMLLAADRPDRAADALDRAGEYLDAHDQRYAEGLVLLLRARWQQHCGLPVATVRATAERARALSVEREAHLFTHRADQLLAELARPGVS